MKLLLQIVLVAAVVVCVGELTRKHWQGFLPGSSIAAVSHSDSPESSSVQALTEWQVRPSVQRIYAGEDAVFTLAAGSDANGKEIHYQWYHDSLPLTGTDALGVGVFNAQLTDNGVYRVQARLSDGTQHSASARLAVTEATEPVDNLAPAVAGAVNCPTGALPIGLPHLSQEALAQLYNNGTNLMAAIPAGTPGQSMRWMGGPSAPGRDDKCYFELECINSRWYSRGLIGCH